MTTITTRPRKSIDKKKSDDIVISTLDDIYGILPDVPGLDYKVNFVHATKTKNRSTIMSIGRVWFNLLLPDDYPLVDDVVDKKKLMNIINEIKTKYDPNTAADVVTRIQKEASKMSMYFPVTFSSALFTPPKDWVEKKRKFIQEIDKILEEASKKGKNPVSEFDKRAKEIIQDLIKYLEENNVNVKDIFKSGAKGNLMDDLVNLFASRGYILDVEGNLIGPIKSSLDDGYDIKEFYYAAAEARRNSFYRSCLTQHPGYLNTKLAMANANLKVSDSVTDCKTRGYMQLTVTEEIAPLILSRYYNDNGKLVLIDNENSKDLVGKTIKLRSPIYCKSEDFCHICYGDGWKKYGTRNVGLLAAGAINIIGINTLMKMRHKASAVLIKEVDFNKIIEKSGINVSEVKSVFNVEKTKISAKYNCSVTINEKDYDDLTFQEFDKYLLLPGILKFFIKDVVNTFVTVAIPIQVKLHKTMSMSYSNGIYQIDYSPGELVISQEYTDESFNEYTLGRLFDGNTKYASSPDVLVMIIHENIKSVDLIHIETIVSNMFRDPEDETVPMRLKYGDNVKAYDKAVIIGQKRLPFISSWLNAMAFESIQKAIKVGLVHGKKIQSDPIENIILEQF